MPIVARDSKGEFTPAPEGLHQAVCCDVVDIGLVRNQWGEQHKVEIRWQLEIENEKNGKPFMVVRRYTLSLHAKSTLRQHLEAWRSKKFTAEELEGFDLEKLIGANCQVQIVHNVSDDGKTFGNLQAIVPVGRGMTKMQVTDDYVRTKDRDGAKGEEAPPPDDSDVPF
jgi:hypothetical protein